MSSSILYKMEQPRELGSGLQSPTYYIPRTKAGAKTAQVMHNLDKKEKLELFKHAKDMGTKDLAKAYVDLKDIGDEIDRESKRRDELRPDAGSKKDVEVEMEPAIERDIQERNREVKEDHSEQDFNYENDVVIFKTWLDD